LEKNKKIISYCHRILLGRDSDSSDLNDYPLLPCGLHCSNFSHQHVDFLTFFLTSSFIQIAIPEL